jgi:hypothetical protein
MIYKNKMKPFKIVLGISFISVILGFLIYLLLRPVEIPIVSYLISKAPIIGRLRKEIGRFRIPAWIIYNLPDAIWAYSFVLIMTTIWGSKKRKENILWILLTIIISIGYEVGQLFNIVPGTFDFLDLIFIILGIGMGIGTVVYINYFATKK